MRCPWLTCCAAVLALGCAPIIETMEEESDGSTSDSPSPGTSTGGPSPGTSTSGPGPIPGTTTGSSTATTGGVTTGGTTVEPADPCEDGTPPVVYYPFDECEPMTPDARGTGPDLELVSASCGDSNSLGSALGGAWSSGTALACTGNPAQCVAGPDDPVFEPEIFSISAWVFSPDWTNCGDFQTPGETCTIVNKGNTDDDSNGYWLSIDPLFGPPAVRLVVAAGGGATEREAMGGALSNDTWHHIVATHDGAVATVYLDGQPVGSTATVGITYGEEDFLVGEMVNRGFSHNGLVEELMLWHCPMTEAQVATLHLGYTEG